jgi:hypothetical protein
MRKPVKSGLANQRVKQKHSGSSKSFEEIPQKRDFPKSKTPTNVLSSLKESKKELNRVFESLTGEAILDEDEAEELDDLHSKVKSKFAEISDQIKTGSVLNPELITRTLYIELLTTTIDLIPLAEKAYRSSKKESAAYAYTNMVDKAQQLAADIRVLKDTSGQAEFIKDSIIKPIFLALTSTILQEIMLIKSSIDSELTDTPKKGIRLKAKCDDSARSVADFMNKSLLSVHEQVHSFLSGDYVKPQSRTSR